MSKGWWQIIAAVAVSGCLLMGFAVLWAVRAYGSNLDAIAKANGPLCMSGGTPYDSIAAAQQIGRLDQVTFLLTVGGILFAIFALVGAWTIRREALDNAREAAEQKADEVARDLTPPLVLRNVTEALESMRQEGRLMPDASVQDIVDALDGDENGATGQAK